MLQRPEVTRLEERVRDTGCGNGRGRWIVVAAIGLLGVLALATVARAGLTPHVNTAVVPPKGKATTATPPCPSGSAVAAAGFRNTIGPGGSPDTQMTRLDLRSSGVLRAGATDNDHAAPGAVTAIAYCGTVPSLTAKTKSVKVPSARARTKPSSVTATCPRGKRVAFGGFTGEFAANHRPALYLSAMMLTSPRAWTVSGLNLGKGKARLKAIAYCGKVKPVHTTKSSVKLPASGVGGDTNGCPSGQALAFGGFKATVTKKKALVLIRDAEISSFGDWQVEAITPRAVKGKLTGYAYCR